MISYHTNTFNWQKETKTKKASITDRFSNKFFAAVLEWTGLVQWTGFYMVTASVMKGLSIIGSSKPALNFGKLFFLLWND